MKRILAWLKAKAREWAGDADGRVSVDRKALLALQDAYVKALRTPFEARESESAPPWGNEDANNWRKFLASSTGERLRRLINYWTQLEAQKAAMRHDKHEYACGLAAGWWNEGDFILNKLSADLPLQTEGDTEQGKGAAGYRERVAP